jgi:hypothetical protein
MVKNIIEMSGKSPKELYIKYKKKYMKLKNMIGGASEYEVSIDEKGMQPMSVIDEDGLLQTVLESKKLINIGEGLYLDAIKSKVYVFEDGKINKYDLQYGSSGGGLSAYGETYYYIKSDGKRIYLDNLSKYYENFIEFEEQSYNFIPSIMEFPIQRRPRGTIAIYRDDSKEGEAITAELGKFKKEYDKTQRITKPTIGTLSQSTSSELSRLTTGEEKPTFHIYTTGLNKLYGGFDCFKCFKVFMNLFNEHFGSGVSVSIFHYVIDSDKQEGNTYNERDLIALSQRYKTNIIKELLMPDIIIDKHATFKFVFDCSGMVYNHPLKGLVFDEKYFDKHRIGLKEGLSYDEHIELFQGMHCPLSDYPNNYMIQIDDGKVLTVYDILVKFNKSRGSPGVIDILGKIEGFEYLPETIFNEVRAIIKQRLFNSKKNRENMLSSLEILRKNIRNDFLDELAYVLDKRAIIPDGLITITVMIMLERLIINTVGSTLGIERPDSNEYFQSMTNKYGDAIRLYFQKPNDKPIEYLVESIIDSETQHHR